MKTFSVNRLAEMLEKDRATMVRVLRNVLPDAEITKGRPTWKLATAARALEKHNRAQDGGGNGGATAASPPEYALYDRAYDAMKALPTLAARRKAAVKLVPLINDMIQALTAHGRDAGEDPEVTGMRSDRVYQLTLAGFQGPCEWTHEQVWHHLSIDTDADAMA